MKIITRKEAKEQGLKRYFTGKPCKHGHVSERLTYGGCIECKVQYRIDNKVEIANRNVQYQKDNREKVTQYRIDNKDKIAKRKAKYRKDNKEEVAKCSAKYREDNKEKIAKYLKDNKDKIAERQAQWREDNKEEIAKYSAKYRIDNKDHKVKYNAQYNIDNPLPLFIRNSINRILNNWKGGREKAEELFGYTIDQLAQRIECQFKDGMSWENRSEWHIDHKKPVARFIKQGITEPKIINALSNLQPLWAKDNVKKGSKF